MLLATAAFSLVQILLGAVTRHTYSGMAITDFPLNNGSIIPAFTSFGVGIQFAHRVGALILSVLVFWQGVRVYRLRLTHLRTPATLAMAMIVVQVLLGATVIWTREAVIPNTLHVAGGALTFALTFLTWWYSTRYYHFAGRQHAAEEMHMQGAEA
jgi:cytochrome c oxidase assembly protein subunit 15